MSFISLTFAIFFIIFITVYHLVGHFINNYGAAVLTQKIIFLAANIIFYVYADIRFLPFLLYSILITYLSGRFSRNKMLFIIFIVASLAPLLFCKYNPSHIIFPLGISFFTFQSIGYIVDSYKNDMAIQQNRGGQRILDVALFITYFPVISSGPIQRADKLIPQFNIIHHYNYDDASDGMKLFAWGLFKKLCIADKIGLYVNFVYSNVNDKYGVAVLFATILYSFQIYCDFSGYSDMAIGIAKYCGFNVEKNFNHPYLSSSCGEFWRRWHISLSTWLRDYVYIPLGGSRVVLPRLYLNLIITFLVSGIWHGAGLMFVIWGLLHGIFQCIGRATNNIWEKIHVPKFLRVFITFCLITFAWIFFRAESLQSAGIVINKILYISQNISDFLSLKNTVGLKESIRILFAFTDDSFGGFSGMAVTVVMLFSFVCCEVVCKNQSGIEWIKKRPVVLRWCLYIILVSIILPNLVTNNNTEFLYFAF